jgi:hypothetical protein
MQDKRENGSRDQATDCWLAYREEGDMRYAASSAWDNPA